jgi:hypothetical protein
MFLSDASSEGSQYALRRIDSNWRLVTKSPLMRPVVFGEGLSAEARLALFSGSKPDRFFTVIKFWLDETSGIALALKGGVPTYQVEDGLPRRSSGLRRARGVTSFAGGGRKAEHTC